MPCTSGHLLLMKITVDMACMHRLQHTCQPKGNMRRVDKACRMLCEAFLLFYSLCVLFLVPCFLVCASILEGGWRLCSVAGMSPSDGSAI